MKKNKNKKIYLILTLVIILILIGMFILLNKHKHYSYDNYLYKIYYYDEFTPGNNYDIYFFENKKIIVICRPGCSTLECLNGTYEPKERKTVIKFSEENKQKLFDWAKALHKENPNTKEITIHPFGIEEQNETIIKSIIYNNENLLNQKTSL